MRIIAFGTAGEFWSDGKGLKQRLFSGYCKTCKYNEEINLTFNNE